MKNDPSLNSAVNNASYLTSIKTLMRRLWKRSRSPHQTWDVRIRPLINDLPDPLDRPKLLPQDCGRIIISKTATYACNDPDYIKD